MTVKWIDGFDNQDYTKRWGVTGTGALTTGRFTTYALRLTNTENVSRSLTGLGSLSTVGVGVAVKPETAASGVRCIDISGAGTLQILSGASGGAWTLVHSRSKSSTSLGLLSVPLSASVTNGVWTHFEVIMYLGAGSGQVVVKVDSVQVYSYVGDTYNDATASGTFTTLKLNSNATTGSYLYDDVWISDGTLHGDHKIMVQYANTDAVQGWAVTPAGNHWDAVDPPPDFDPAQWPTTGFIATAGDSGQADTFKVPVPTANYISAVQVSAVGYKSDAGTGNVVLMADNQQGTAVSLPTATPSVVSQMFPTANGGTSWTPSLVGTAQFGVRTGVSTYDAAYSLYDTILYV